MIIEPIFVGFKKTGELAMVKSTIPKFPQIHTTYIIIPNYKDMCGTTVDYKELSIIHTSTMTYKYRYHILQRLNYYKKC